MNDKLDLSQIKAYVLQSKKHHNSSVFHRIYDLSFKAWHETWEKTYQEDFHSTKKLNSDTYSRQDDSLSLFYNDVCFAVCIFSHHNMTDELSQLDSYFNYWPQEAIKTLCSNGLDIIACTQYTICENFRDGSPANSGKIPWRMLMTGMIAKYFLDSQKDAMAAIARVNKGIDKFSYQNGGIQLVKGLEYEAGADKTLVDLIAFFPDEVHKLYSQHPYAKYFDELWENRNGKLSSFQKRREEEGSPSSPLPH